MPYRKQDKRALRALAGLVLVAAMALVYAHGKLEARLTQKFSGYAEQEQVDIDNLDLLLDEYDKRSQ